MKILDLGCGDKKYKPPQKNAVVIGLDIIRHPSVDVVHDLNKFPYPFKNNEFDVVHANHIFEHIQDNKVFFRVMREIHRILKHKGKLIVKVPYWKGIFAFCFPEHGRYFNSYYFNYFDNYRKKREHTGHLSNFSGVNFRVVKNDFNMVIDGRLKFLNILNPLYNLHKTFTEMFLSNVLAPEELHFELEAIKE